MTTPPARRVQVKRGQRKPAGSKLVTRSSRFGSPFRLIEHGGRFTRDESLAWHRRFLLGDPEAVDLARRVGWRYADLNGSALVAAIRAELPGYDLGCACDPGDDCHADTLLRVATGGEP